MSKVCVVLVFFLCLFRFFFTLCDFLSYRFKAELEFERVVVVSIKSSHQVATYRTTELSKEFHVLREEMNRKPTMVSEKALSREATQDSFGGDPKLSQSNSDAALTTGESEIIYCIIMSFSLIY